MPANTPIYGFPYQELSDPPHGPNLGQDLATAVETEIDRIDTDIADLKQGWNFIASGVETAPFTVDFTAGGKFAAGTFKMLRVNMTVQLDTGNSFVIGRVNGLSGATLYNRGWWGESFDGTTSSRKVSNTSDRAVFGYVSAQIGGNLEVMYYKTDVASEIPMRAISNRGAPDGFDGNREFMHTTNALNTNTLIDSMNFFITGTETIAAAEWFAEGFRV